MSMETILSLELTQTGFAGIDGSGNKVDRRDHFDAVPLAKNPMLNIPSPRCVMCKEERSIEEIKDISCTYCIIEEKKSIEDCYRELAETERKIIQKNKEILRIVTKIRGQSFKRYLKRVMAECEVNSFNSYETFTIVKKPLGEWQHEVGFGSITGYYVEQWSMGMEGDSFAGHITVLIKKDMFLQMPFSC